MLSVLTQILSKLEGQKSVSTNTAFDGFASVSEVELMPVQNHVILVERKLAAGFERPSHNETEYATGPSQ